MSKYTPEEIVLDQLGVAALMEKLAGLEEVIQKLTEIVNEIVYPTRIADSYKLTSSGFVSNPAVYASSPVYTTITTTYSGGSGNSGQTI